MTLRWLERWKRVDALEREIAALRVETAALALEAERANARAAAIDALGDRLTTLKDHVAIDVERSTATGRALSALGERIDRIEQRTAAAAATREGERAEAAKAIDDELASLRVALLRLEQQVRLNAEAADTAVRALLERIELARPAKDG